MIKHKNRLRSELGITLVALIITIIILILLAAVVIINLKENNFIELAMNGALNYAISQTDEEKNMDDLDSSLASAIGKITKFSGTEVDTPDIQDEIKVSVIEKSQNRILISLEYKYGENADIECVLKDEDTDEIKAGNRIGETLNFEFTDLKPGKEYVLIVTYEGGTKNMQVKVNTPEIITASSSTYQAVATIGFNFGDFLQCINNSELIWSAPIDSNARVDTMYLQFELNEKAILSNLSLDASTGSGNYQWGADYGYYGIVLMGSNDGSNFETLSEKKTLTAATTQAGFWYKNDFTFDIKTPYKIYKIAFIDGGKDGITNICNVGSCCLTRFNISFK